MDDNSYHDFHDQQYLFDSLLNSELLPNVLLEKGKGRLLVMVVTASDCVLHARLAEA